MKLLQPAGWQAPRGYSNGVAASGTLVFVAGQIGWNEQCRITSDDFVDQVRQALLNVRAVLAEAGATPQHITRMTWYLVDKREYMSAVQTALDSHCTDIGIDDSQLPIEYPYQALLLEHNPAIRFRHVDVHNASSRYDRNAGPPCIVFRPHR